MSEQQKIILDPKAVLAKIQESYKQSDKITKKANFLIYGKPRCGKTFLLKTAPGPILIHSFDPGGTRTLKEELDSGRIMMESFEHEDAQNPHAFTDWERRFNELGKAGVFDTLGTYVLDSFTFMQSALLNQIAKKHTIKGQASKGILVDGLLQSDYGDSHTYIKHVFNQVLNLPCNVILTAHMTMDKDETDGKIYQNLMAPGQAKTFLPAMFDLYLFLKVQNSSAGVKRTLLTTADGLHDCGSRIGAGKLEKEEVCDLKAILKKAGYPYEDKVL